MIYNLINLNYSKNIFWVFGILLRRNVGFTRDWVVKKTFKIIIYKQETFFYPMHKQKIFQKMKLFSKKQKFLNAEYLSKYGFYLPSGLGITNNEIDFVGKTLVKILEN